MRHSQKTLKCISRKHKVSRKVFDFTLDLMSRHLKFPAAGNSLYSSREINSCLLNLSLMGGYAEGGLADLSLRCSLPNHVPTGRAFRGRVERVEVGEVRRILTEANDEVLHTLKGFGIFRRKAVVAVDYKRKPYYGDPCVEMVVGSPNVKGTSWCYCYASIHIVEAGRRLTLYTMPIHQFTDKARAVERLLEEAKARGVHVGLTLLDRAFYTVEVIALLKRLGGRFIMPAVKNRKVKEAIRSHHKLKTDPVQQFTLGRGDHAVKFNLAIYPKPEQNTEKERRRKRRPIHERYLAFATNIPKPQVNQLPMLIPQEYRRRWGIETGYRVQGTVEAKTTSRNYALRLLYHMHSVALYNIWQYANLLLARALKQPFLKPLITLGNLAAHFEAFILGGLGPPQP